MSDSESDWEEENPSIVVDNGSDMIKCGFGGDDAPRAVFPSVVGRLKRRDIMVGIAHKDLWVGDEAWSKWGILSLQHPIKHGFMTSWGDMEKIWHHAFYGELKFQPEEHAFVLSETPLNPKEDREKMAQIMFETFNVPGLYLAVDAALALYASGRTTGIVLDCGHGVTSTVPIYEGYALPHAVNRWDIAGRDITTYLMQYFPQLSGCSSSDRYKRDNVRPIKEKVCSFEPKLAVFHHYYLAANLSERAQIMDNVFGGDISRILCQYLPRSVEQDFAYLSILDDAGTRDYKLPDENIISVGDCRLKAPQILFWPHLIGESGDGVHKMVFDSIKKCDKDIQGDLFENVVLCGGSTLFPGISDILESELRLLASDSTKIKVIAPPERKYTVWIGGSILSSLSTFGEMCATKSEYDEIGPRIVHRKCF